MPGWIEMYQILSVQPTGTRIWRFVFRWHFLQIIKSDLWITYRAFALRWFRYKKYTWCDRNQSPYNECYFQQYDRECNYYYTCNQHQSKNYRTQSKPDVHECISYPNEWILLRWYLRIGIWFPERVLDFTGTGKTKRTNRVLPVHRVGPDHERGSSEFFFLNRITTGRVCISFSHQAKSFFVHLFFYSFPLSVLPGILVQPDQPGISGHMFPA